MLRVSVGGASATLQTRAALAQGSG